jgi:hypothetical protein
MFLFLSIPQLEDIVSGENFVQRFNGRLIQYSPRSIVRARRVSFHRSKYLLIRLDPPAPCGAAIQPKQPIAADLCLEQITYNAIRLIRFV